MNLLPKIKEGKILVPSREGMDLDEYAQLKIYPMLPGFKQVRVQTLVRREGLTWIKALERVGVMVCVK